MDAPRPLRCFVGLPLPEEWQAGLARVGARLSGLLASRITWTRPGTGHVTLKFLGDVDEALVPAVRAALGGVAFAPFVLALGRAGFFSPAKSGSGRGAPRALWAGLARGGPECAALAASVACALAPLGFAAEDRGFAAHVTLGRVRRAAQGDDWGEVQRALAAEAWSEARADRFVLWRSILGPSGPRYDALAEFPARAGAWKTEAGQEACPCPAPGVKGLRRKPPYR